MMKRFLLWVNLIGLVVWAGGALAQSQPPGPQGLRDGGAPRKDAPEGRRRDLMRTLRTVKQMQLVERLHLTPEEALKLAPLFSQYDEASIHLHALKRQRLKDLKRALASGTGAADGEEALAEAVDRFLQEERRLEQARWQAIEALRRELGAERFGRWLLFEEAFRRDLSRVLKQLRRRGEDRRGDEHRPPQRGEGRRPGNEGDRFRRPRFRGERPFRERPLRERPFRGRPPAHQPPEEDGADDDTSL